MTSVNLAREDVDEGDRWTCILSSRSVWFGEGDADPGDSVAIGGRAIDGLLAACCCCCTCCVWPLAPIGRGCGGRTAGSGGLGGNGSRASGECDAGCVRKGMGEGRVEGIEDGRGVRLPETALGEVFLRFIMSTRVRLLFSESS